MSGSLRLQVELRFNKTVDDLSMRRLVECNSPLLGGLHRDCCRQERLDGFSDFLPAQGALIFLYLEGLGQLRGLTPAVVTTRFWVSPLSFQAPERQQGDSHKRILCPSLVASKCLGD